MIVLKNPSNVSILSILVCFIISFIPSTGQSDDWDQYYNAERSAKDLMYSYEDLRKLNINETQRLISAICESDEEERAYVSSDVGQQVLYRVRDEYLKLEQRKNEALNMLNTVISDPKFQSKRSDAEQLLSNVMSNWQTIDRMTSYVRGSNHPVVSYMLTQGQQVDAYRKGRCTAAQVDTGNGFADCVGYDGNACLIVEFKPDNSRAISKGQQQLSAYKRGLESNPDKRQSLNSRSTYFSACQTFETRVDCYRLCPQVDEYGNFSNSAAEWRTGC